MNFLNRFVFYLFILFQSSQLVYAKNYNGIVTKLSSRVAFKDSVSGKKYYFIYGSSEIQNQISKLKSSDFISLEGKTDEKAQTLTVVSVNYVGLQDLIGSWSGDDDFCYFFKSFTDVSIYQKTKTKKCDYTDSLLVRKLIYTLNSYLTNWLALFSDNSETYVMELILKSKTSAELSLYNPESGDILKEIQLKK